MYSLFLLLKANIFINWSSWLRFFYIFYVIGNNIYLTWIVVNRIQFILSENGDSKEIRELLLVTSYNEIPNRCNLLLNSYGRKENALLAFIDKDFCFSLYNKRK